MPIQEIRQHCRNLARVDLYFLLRYGLRRADIEKPWLLDRCREVEASPNGMLDLWAREHYKSTIITFGKTIQDILASHGDDPLVEWNGIEPTFCIFSHTRPIAKGFLRQIKTEFEQNKLLYGWFPDVLWDSPKKEAPKWSEDDGIVVKRKGNPKESTVEAWGLVDGQPTSKHFYVRIYDDVVTVESVNTAEMIKKTTDRWELSLNLGVDDGIERYAGTRYDEMDSYNTLLERKVATPRIYPATEDGTANGKPVLMSDEALAVKRRGMNAYNFSCQMLQNPTPDENAFFRMVEGINIRWFDPDNPPAHLNIYGATDAATKHDKGDWTVHIPFGVDPNDNIFLLDMWRKQAQTDVLIDAQIDLMRIYQPLRWFGEGGPIESAIGPFRHKRMRERRVFCTYDTLPSIADKPTRARAFQGRWNMGMVYLPIGAPWVTDFLIELKRFPNSNVDDIPDTCSLIGRVLDSMYGAAGPLPEPNRNPFSLKNVIAKLEDEKKTGYR